MSLKKVNHLYRLRVCFDHERHITLVETVHRDVVLEDGVPMAGPPVETARAYDLKDLKVAAAIGNLVDEVFRLGKEMDERAAAEAARRAKEEADRQAAEAEAAEKAKA